MLQALPADRFKLTIRRETKEMSIYALVVGKRGPKLPKADIRESPEIPESGPRMGTLSAIDSMAAEGEGCTLERWICRTW
jgi:uncharacterized protein (TIGR03435 family)